MRITTVLVFVLLGVAACGHANGNGVATAGRSVAPSSSASTSGQNDQEQMLKFARCMRDNGVPDFPDPKFDDNGGVSLDLPPGADKAKVDAAQEKCKQLLPNGGEQRPVDAETLEKMRKYAECMRASGVPKFPDPDPNGGFKINAGPGLDPQDPTFQAADKKCQQYMPAGPGGGMQTRNNG